MRKEDRPNRDAEPGRGPEKTMLGQLFEASGVGIQLVASTFAGLAIGYGLDRLFGTSPWLAAIFLIIGIISGFVNLFRLARRADREKNGRNDTQDQ